MTTEIACPNCQRLEADLAARDDHIRTLTSDEVRVKRDLSKVPREELETQVAMVQRAYSSLNRKHDALAARYTELVEGAPVNHDARKLFDHFVEKLSKPKTFRFGDKRQALLQKALAQWGWDECARAIDGLALKPHVGPRGRSEKPYPGSSVKNDVEHALGDEQRLERCQGYIEEAEARTFAVIAEDCKATLARTEGYRPDDYQEAA